MRRWVLRFVRRLDVGHPVLLIAQNRDEWDPMLHLAVVLVCSKTDKRARQRTPDVLGAFVKVLIIMGFGFSKRGD